MVFGVGDDELTVEFSGSTGSPDYVTAAILLAQGDAPCYSPSPTTAARSILLDRWFTMLRADPSYCRIWTMRFTRSESR
jgi:hypothetical protein